MNSSETTSNLGDKAPYDLHCMEQYIQKSIYLSKILMLTLQKDHQIQKKETIESTNLTEEKDALQLLFGQPLYDKSGNKVNLIEIQQTIINKNKEILQKHLNGIRTEIIIPDYILAYNDPKLNRYKQMEDNASFNELSKEISTKLENLKPEEIGKLLYYVNLKLGEHCVNKFLDGAVYTAALYLNEMNSLYINNVGDCVALLLTWDDKENRFIVEQINQAHDLSNMNELERLVALGAEIKYETEKKSRILKKTTVEMNGFQYEETIT